MFERFTERARQVVVLGQDEARALKHNYIGTEHLLLGLLREEEGIACRVLSGLEVDTIRVRSDIARLVGEGDQVVPGQIPFTPRAKKVLELALREALSLGHNYIGTEHVLLGLLREQHGIAARLLTDYIGPDFPEKIRNEVIRLLSRPGRRPEPVAGTARVVQAKQDRVARTGRCVAQMPLFGITYRCQGEPEHEGAHWEQGSTGDGDRWLVAWA